MFRIEGVGATFSRADARARPKPWLDRRRAPRVVGI